MNKKDNRKKTENSTFEKNLDVRLNSIRLHSMIILIAINSIACAILFLLFYYFQIKQDNLEFGKTIVSMSLTIFGFSITIRNILIGRNNENYYISMGNIFDLSSHIWQKSAWYIVLGVPLIELLILGIFSKPDMDTTLIAVGQIVMCLDFSGAFILILYYFHSILNRMNEEVKIPTVAQYLAYLIIKSSVSNGETKRKVIIQKNNILSYICSLTPEKPLFYTKFTMFCKFSELMNEIYFNKNNKKIFEEENYTNFFCKRPLTFIKEEINTMMIEIQTKQDDKEDKFKENLMNEEAKYSYLVLSNLFSSFDDTNREDELILAFLKNYIIHNTVSNYNELYDDNNKVIFINEEYWIAKIFILFYTMFWNIDIKIAFAIFKDIIHNDLNSWEIEFDILNKVNTIAFIALCYVFCIKHTDNKLTTQHITEFMEYWCVDSQNIPPDILKYCKSTYSKINSQSDENNSSVIDPLLLLLKHDEGWYKDVKS